MSSKLAAGRSARAVLDLLKDPEFCADAQRVLQRAAALRAQAPPPEEWQRRTQELVQPFLARWGVVPPTTSELLDADPRRRLVQAIASGRWGVVPVFPWTTDREIRGRAKKIRSMIGKQHKDALVSSAAQLVQWLEACGFKRPTIARAVFRRRTGLSRPTKTQAIARAPEYRERQLYEKYGRLGLTENKIEQRVYKRLRGSEAPASAVVRVTARRYVKRIERLNEVLVTPVQSEPLSHELTTLFRALPDADGAAVKQLALAVQAGLAAASADQHGAAAQPGLHEALASGRWGLVLVFPWTTDPDIRAHVNAVQAVIRAPTDGATQAPATPSDASPSDKLMLLFQALAESNDGQIKDLAMAARASFLKASTP